MSEDFYDIATIKKESGYDIDIVQRRDVNHVNHVTSRRDFRSQSTELLLSERLGEYRLNLSQGLTQLIMENKVVSTDDIAQAIDDCLEPLDGYIRCDVPEFDVPADRRLSLPVVFYFSGDTITADVGGAIQ